MTKKACSGTATVIATALAAVLTTALTTGFAALAAPGALGNAGVAGASPPLGVATTSGSPQDTALDTTFSSVLVATVSGLTAGASCPGALTFEAPSSGPSATFSATGTDSDSPSPTSATADGNGDCTYDSSSLSANGDAGGYDVSASVTGGGNVAEFSLTNDGVSVLSGSPQTAQDGTAFSTRFAVAVFAHGAPVVGASVSFTAPSSGASGVFASTNTRSASVATDATGVATAPAFTANDTPGSYTVHATTSAVSGTASFALTNSGAGVAHSVTARDGSLQSTVVGTAYPGLLEARVTDANGNPVQGVTVAFSAGAGPSGASASFLGGGGAATATTDSSGNAYAPELQANDVAGTFSVTATVQGVTGAAVFTLTNLASAAASVVPGAGVTQEAATGTAFAIPLSVTVTDAEKNPVVGAAVTFDAPSSGPSGTFSTTATRSVTVDTDASGIAVAPAFRANGVAGGYIVTASVGGGAPTAAFALVNTAGTGASPSPAAPHETYAGIARDPAGHGYWLVAKDGGVFGFGGAPSFGSLPKRGIHVDDIVGIASTPDGKGYWLVGSTGNVYAFGDAGAHGSAPADGIHVTDVVGLASTPDGKGYWLVGKDGGVFTFGDAAYRGSVPAEHVRVSDIVGIARTASGKGYWLATKDGRVYSFGDAAHLGSPASHRVHVDDVVAIAPAPDAKGYWLVGSDGGVFSFGDARYRGSVPGDHLHVTDVDGAASTVDGKGYWLVGRNGRVFGFGDA